jgi:glycosyltransferase involved in cell wall biosynthesis
MSAMSDLLNLAPLSAAPASVPPRAAARVLHLINGEYYAGAERVQDLLALRLPDEGFEVGFACLKPDRFPKTRRAQDAPLVELPMRHKLDVAVVARLARLARDGRYELIHAHTPRTAVLGRLAAKWTGLPFVYHVHSPTSRDSTRRWQNRANALAERIAIAGASQLVAVSQSLGEHMRRVCPPGAPVAVVPNGVPEVHPDEKAPPRGVWTLGVVALFRPRKGLEVLLEALAVLKRSGANFRLRAVGGFETPEYEAHIHALANRFGVAELIDWTGFTRDVRAELARMDVMALPSLFGEGLPMVVLEAMAAGVPVVATRVEGVPEAIRDGQDGVLVEPGDAAALAAGLRRLIDGRLDWSSLRQSALRRHAEQFSDRAMAAELAKLYRRILERDGTR